MILCPPLNLNQLGGTKNPNEFFGKKVVSTQNFDINLATVSFNDEMTFSDNRNGNKILCSNFFGCCNNNICKKKTRVDHNEICQPNPNHQSQDIQHSIEFNSKTKSFHLTIWRCYQYMDEKK
jgi:hypothetical protein